MKKLAIAASSVALAAMPVVGVFAATTDDLVITDTLEITVDPTCTFSATTGGGSTGAFDTTYAATVANGATAQFKVDNANKSDHIFGVVCNDDEGWQVTASAPLALSASGVDAKHNIVYNAAALPDVTTSKPTEGYWNAVVTGTNVAPASTEQAPTGIVVDGGVNYIKGAGGVIATEADSTDGSTFTVTYGAYVGTETPAGTYTATASLGDNNTNTGSNGDNANDGGGTIDYVLSVL